MICIIPARGGSRRIPGKNIKDFHGLPIIAHSINTARASKLFKSVIVSTDSPEIGDVAREYGARPVSRHPLFAQDWVGTQRVAKHVLKDQYSITYPDITCVMYATAPMVTVDELKQAHRIVYGGADYAVSVDENCEDVGGFYMGWSFLFLEEVPLEGHSVYVRTDDIDINTLEDWALAEKLYEERYGTGTSMAG